MAHETFRQLRDVVRDVMAGLRREHQGEERMPDFCVLLHEDLGLGEDQLDDETIERMKHLLLGMGGKEEDLPEPGTIRTTHQHSELHAWIQALAMELTTMGLEDDQLLAALVLIGRRWGKMDAAKLLSSNPDKLLDERADEPGDLTIPEDWS